MFPFLKKTKISGKVSILIPTMLDSRYMIELCLKSIKKYTDYPEYQIIVCNAGVDDSTRNYLTDLTHRNEIQLIEALDWQRPKDDLVNVVESEYYVLMHDDIQIVKTGWLTRRMILMNRSAKNAIVGTIVRNYKKDKRFFPLGLLVKTDISRKLDLKWGKRPGYDTGGLAYKKFFSQKEYQFVPYKVSKDIKHFSEMTWPKYHTQQNIKGLDKILNEREAKVRLIREILANNKY